MCTSQRLHPGEDGSDHRPLSGFLPLHLRELDEDHQDPRLPIPLQHLLRDRGSEQRESQDGGFTVTVVTLDVLWDWSLLVVCSFVNLKWGMFYIFQTSLFSNVNDITFGQI